MIQYLPLASLSQNRGQIEGLPSNPRQWTQTDMDMLANEWDDLPLKDWGVDIGEWKPLNDVKPVKEHEDLSGQMDALYQICIDCEDEAEQEQIYNELRNVYKCRVLTL